MNYDIVIIGAGIVGLATGLKIKEKRPKIKLAILDKENEVARHQTGNNSGVIHAGIYYKPGSLKALNCKTGYQMLIEFCDKERIQYDLCGKLIVATRKDELPKLDELYERAVQNGLDKVKRIRAEEITDYEPHAMGLAALHVPYTGITDFKEISEKYAQIIKERFEGDILLSSKVNAINTQNTHTEVITGDKAISTRLVVNTAGLFSDKIAAMTQKKVDVRIIPFRGEYSILRPEKHNLVKNLIYPVPDPDFPFLGVHFTRLIKGGVEAGPNAVWAFKREGYKFTDFSLPDVIDSLTWKGFIKVMWKYWKMGLGEYWRAFSKTALTAALQRLVPEVNKEDIIPGGSGVRAQACDRNGGLVDDFLFVEDRHTVNVLNAPSPAATASLAIGETISDKVIKRL